MKRILAFAAIFVVVCLFPIQPGFSQEDGGIKVKASESAKEAIREKGPDLYIRIGIYRGY